MEYPEDTYIFNCMKKEDYTGTLDDFADDYEYQLYVVIGYKDNKLYFPYLHYHEFDNNITFIYHNIYLKNYDVENIHNFILKLYELFSKDFIHDSEVILATSISSIDWEKSQTNRRISKYINLFNFTLDNLNKNIDIQINTNMVTRSAGLSRDFYYIDPQTRSDNNLLKIKYPELDKWMI